MGSEVFDREKACAPSNIPEGFEMSCWVIGYLEDPDTLPGRLRERELASHSCRPLTEFGFTEWEVRAIAQSQTSSLPVTLITTPEVLFQ